MSRSSTPLVLVVVALLTAPIAGAANGTPTALTLRGQALNKTYHLGAYAGTPKQATHALTLRGQALNRIYRLGAYTGPTPQGIHAITLRGQALNQTYHLGAYADRTGSSFPWLAAVFAAAAAVGVILAAFAGTVGVRRRRGVIAL